MRKKNLKIQQPTSPEPEIPVVILAKSIELLAKGMKVLNETNLNKDCVELLVAKAANVNLGETRRVLNALTDLEYYYLKPKKDRK